MPPQPTRSPLIAVLPVCLMVAVAGISDSLMFLHSSELLPVYMSGNSSRLGRTLILGQWPALGPIVAVIAAFFAMTTFTAWLGTRSGRYRAAVNLAITAALLLAAWPLTREQYSAIAVALIAAAMGAINQVLADEPGVTFVTGALIRLSRSIVARDACAIAGGLLRWLAWVMGAALGTLLDIRIQAPTLLLLAIGAATGALICACRTAQRGAGATEHP